MLPWSAPAVLAQGGERQAQAQAQGVGLKLHAVTVQDFERISAPLSVWVVNIPNENASVRLSTTRPHSGKNCLELDYKFVGTGQFQYLGIPIKAKIQAPVHTLGFMLRGDSSKCSYGLRLTDASGETHQYTKSTDGPSTIDSGGWKEAVFDLDAGHETWGGDKNGKLDYPITEITPTIGQPTVQGKLLPAAGKLAFDSLSVSSEKNADETLGLQVAVVSPEYGSDVRGDTHISVTAPGFSRLTVRCWKQDGKFGKDSTVADVALESNGDGSFVFPADRYPHGPITVRNQRREAWHQR